MWHWLTEAITVLCFVLIIVIDVWNVRAGVV